MPILGFKIYQSAFFILILPLFLLIDCCLMPTLVVFQPYCGMMHYLEISLIIPCQIHEEKNIEW
jgi:hypothetical protein